MVRNTRYYDQLLSLQSGASTELSQQRPTAYSYYYDGEKLLEDCQASPVGHRVPSLPDFEIDPTLINNIGMSCFSLNAELAFGIFLTIATGCALMYLAFTSLDDEVFKEVDLFITNILGNRNETESSWSLSNL
jgi:hypothetical protein